MKEVFASINLLIGSGLVLIGLCLSCVLIANSGGQGFGEAILFVVMFLCFSVLPIFLHGLLFFVNKRVFIETKSVWVTLMIIGASLVFFYSDGYLGFFVSNASYSFGSIAFYLSSMAYLIAHYFIFQENEEEVLNEQGQ